MKVRPQRKSGLSVSLFKNFYQRSTNQSRCLFTQRNNKSSAYWTKTQLKNKLFKGWRMSLRIFNNTWNERISQNIT